jgi:putative tricarboxylic transport membrane protein
MNFSYITPNLVTGSLSVLLGLIIIYLIPTQLEQPVLIFGQSSAETDPELFPGIVAALLILFGLYTAIFDRKALSWNSWPQISKESLKNVSITILSIIVYSILFEKLGFVISSLFLILFIGNYLGGVSFNSLLIISIIFPLSVFSLFVSVMHVFLPAFPFYEMRLGNFLLM